MSIETIALDTTDEGQTSFRSVPSVMSLAEKTAAITRVRYLERKIFDDSGHIRRRTDRATAEEVVGQINDLRHALGWLEIDLDGRWRWPA
jgi:hypothetical protein